MRTSISTSIPYRTPLDLSCSPWTRGAREGLDASRPLCSAQRGEGLAVCCIGWVRATNQTAGVWRVSDLRSSDGPGTVRCRSGTSDHRAGRQLAHGAASTHSPPTFHLLASAYRLLLISRVLTFVCKRYLVSMIFFPRFGGKSNFFFFLI